MEIEGTPQQDPAPAAAQAADPQQAQEGLKEVNFQQKVTELENFLSERDKEIAELRKNLDDARTEFGSKAEEAHKSMEDWMHKADELRSESLRRDQAMSRLLTAYRSSIMQAHPDIPEEMVTGNSLEELQESLNKAKVLAQKIREKAPQTTPTVPAGAPVRHGPDFSAMSSREKIVHGLRK